MAHTKDTYNPTPERLLPSDLGEYPAGVCAIRKQLGSYLRGVKPEYSGLDSHIQGLEIYSLGPQVSIIAPQKWKRMPGGGWPAVKYRANNLSRVGWTVRRSKKSLPHT